MPDLYSQLLAVAGVAAAGVAARLGMRRALLVQWVPLLSGVSILVLGVASVSHLFVAHGHDSADPLEPMAFLGAHPALAVIAFLALLTLAARGRSLWGRARTTALRAAVPSCGADPRREEEAMRCHR